MRVAIFTETYLPSTDGVVTRLLHTLEELGRQGHEALVLAPDGGPATYAGMRVEGFPGNPFFLYPEKRIIWPRHRVLDLLDEFQPDLIHMVNPAVFGMGAILASRAMGLPLVASYHTHFAHYAELYGLGWLTPGIWGYMRLLHNRATINLCTSEAALQELEQRGFKRVRLWPKAVDLHCFRPQPPDPRMRHLLSGGDPAKTLLLFVGRLAAEKQILRLLPLLRAAPDVCLALVGDGPRRAELEQAFSGTRTVFAGWLHGAELAAAYSAADAFMFPSTTETLGLVLLEAMATGLPVIAAASAPTRELLDDGGGLLYDADQTDTMLAAVRAIADPAVRERLSLAARRRSADHGWDAATRQLVRYYVAALSIARGSPASAVRVPDEAGVGGG